MKRLHDRITSTLGVVVGLVTGLLVLNPAAVKAIGMLPVLSILTPSQNQEVSGYVTFYAVADAEGIASLQFLVDGVNVGAEIGAGSCRVAWNSNDATDGLHTVQAIGRDEGGSTISSAPVAVRVNNFIPPPPPPPGAGPTPPPTTTPPPITTPPTTPPPGPPTTTESVVILSPGANSQVAGTVPVTVAIPRLTSELWVQLKDVWGVAADSWGGAVAPSQTASTVQVNVSIAGKPAANYVLEARAVVNGQQIVSAPVPVRIENGPVTGPPPAPGQPSRTSAGVRPRAGRLPQTTDYALASTATSPSAKAGSRNVMNSSTKPGSTSSSTTQPLVKSGETRKTTQKPPTPRAGKLITVGLGPCTSADPYAKHPTLKGECVSGTWFPRVRKAEFKRPN